MEPVKDELERALARALSRGRGPGRPPGLDAALTDAVFPGGGRVRPLLTLAVGRACGVPDPGPLWAAAVAIELCHGASLVHDDLPAFDDAETRRGAPTVHRRHGEDRAILAGDALIALAFEELAAAPTERPARLVAAIGLLARAIGAGDGLIAGQAWESEPEPPLERYHRSKTAALFEAAAVLPAVLAGADVDGWRAVATPLGLAYQIADDLADVSGVDLGKPAGQDRARGRPNAATELGAVGARARLEGLIAEAVARIPDGPASDGLVSLIHRVGRRLLAP
jgi:geranylgeranyl diphosphate synthase type II